MRRIASLLTLFSPLLFAAGCASHSIHEGYWKISYHAQDSRTRESVDHLLPDLKVKVLVDWHEDPKGEIVEITPVSRHTEEGAEPLRDLKPMYGYIREGETKIEISPENKDASWAFFMEGQIVDAGRINGRRFYARSQLADVSIQGIWRMEHLYDE